MLTRFAAGGSQPGMDTVRYRVDHAILLVPILLLPTVLGRRDDAALWLLPSAGAISVVLALIGFPALGVRGAATGTDVSRGRCGKSNRVGGCNGLPNTSSVVLSSVSTSDNYSGSAGRSPSASSFSAVGCCPCWLGVVGLIVSVLYLFNQGDIFATALPGFPVFDLAGLIGSSGWGLWVAALGVVLASPDTYLEGQLRRPGRSAFDLQIPGNFGLVVCANLCTCECT